MTAHVGPGGLLYRKVSCPRCGSPNGVPLDVGAAGNVPSEPSPDLRCKCHRCGDLFLLSAAAPVPPGNRHQRRALASRRR